MRLHCPNISILLFVFTLPQNHNWFPLLSGTAGQLCGIAQLSQKPSVSNTNLHLQHPSLKNHNCISFGKFFKMSNCFELMFPSTGNCSHLYIFFYFFSLKFSPKKKQNLVLLNLLQSCAEPQIKFCSILLLYNCIHWQNLQDVFFKTNFLLFKLS